MIVESNGYIELIQYLTEQLDMFEKKVPAAEQAPFTVREQLEESLSDKIMRVCQQHDMGKDTRLDIVREADAILYDLEEVLASVLNTHPSPQQQEFIQEFTGLVKNLIDERLQRTTS